MTGAWRFFVAEDQQWYWERSRSTGTSRAHIGYSSYEACVEAAAACGYCFVPSQQPMARAPSVRYSPSRRSGGDNRT